MTQLSQGTLFDAIDAAEDGAGIVTCKFGEAWLGDHPLCAAETDRLCLEFDAAVLRGEFDNKGYTISDLRKQARLSHRKSLGLGE